MAPKPSDWRSVSDLADAFATTDEIIAALVRRLGPETAMKEVAVCAQAAMTEGRDADFQFWLAVLAGLRTL